MAIFLTGQTVRMRSRGVLGIFKDISGRDKREKQKAQQMLGFSIWLG